MIDRYQLWVEGKDDQHVFYQLLEYHKIPEQFSIKSKESITKLLETLRVQLKLTDEDILLERLGVVVDADTNLETRWQQLRQILINSGYPNVLAIPDSDGTIVEHEGRPTIGIWLMPNNVIPGMLEDFVSFLVPADDSLWPRAKHCIQEIPAEERRFIQEHTSKAYIHTWLAWQEEPGEPLGLSIKKRYLDANAPHAQQLMAWIRRLFALDAA